MPKATIKQKSFSVHLHFVIDGAVMVEAEDLETALVQARNLKAHEILGDVDVHDSTLRVTGLFDN